MNELTVISQKPTTALELAGQVANRHAAAAVFTDYLAAKAANTIKTQAAALATFADFLNEAGITAVTPDGLQMEPESWRGVTWGIVKAFGRWMLAQGFSVATINNRLTTVRVYASLAAQAGVIGVEDLALIQTVKTYSAKEARRLDERREVSRVGNKKAEHVSITSSQAKLLKNQGDNSPQSRRDSLLMCLLLDHGLRVGEAAGLLVTDFDLKRGELRFYRPKVAKTQLHKLTRETAKAARAYFTHDAPAMGRALLGSVKGGELTAVPMSERAITKRVAYLGEQVGLDGLSAHDCRHFWATDAARNGTDPFALQQAGGWSSLAMPRRYVEDSRVSNRGVKLSGAA